MKAQDGHTLPSQAGASHPQVRHDPPGGAQTGRLLLVEHRGLFGEGVALLLEWRTGLGCVRAGSLAEARSILEGTPWEPACVVVDLDLPEGEGQEVLEGVGGLPVVALMGGRNLKRQAEAMELGADEVLDTRGPVQKIASAVERLIGTKRSMIGS